MFLDYWHHWPKRIQKHGSGGLTDEQDKGQWKQNCHWLTKCMPLSRHQRICSWLTGYIQIAISSSVFSKSSKTKKIRIRLLEIITIGVAIDRLGSCLEKIVNCGIQMKETLLFWLFINMSILYILT